MERDTLYQRIYEQLLADIQGGRYRAGDRLPSEKDLAEAFQVSRITTKRALGMLMEQGYIERFPGRGSYVRGEAKGGQAQGRMRVVGMILPDFSDSFGMQLIRGAERAARERGCAFFLRLTHGNAVLENEAIRSMLDMNADGIVIMPVHNEYHNPMILRLVLESYPLVLVDRCLEGIQMPLVGIDNYRAAYDGANYLLDRGHRNVAYLSLDPSAASTLQARFKGFLDAFRQRGIPWDEDLMMQGLYTTIPKETAEAVATDEVARISAFFRAHEGITCAFATEYYLAKMAHRALIDIGRRVPEDVSLMGFDGPHNPYSDAFLTRMMQPEDMIGKAAVEVLVRLIEGAREEPGKRFCARLVEGESVKRLEPMA